MFAQLMSFIEKNNLLPQISDTERQALESGTVWVDGEIFSGSPDYNRILREPYGQLTEEEQAFLDGPCEELCRMVDSWEVNQTRKLPADVEKFIKDNGFMGLLIPKEFGGKGFSVLARSAVMTKLTMTSTNVGTYIVIPNSLGAAELLTHYGTQQQKMQYLPKLASGEYVPCFGLTEPTAGSDAASLKAEAIVFKDKDGELKFRMNFRKRYITLAPVANLISLAARVKDPDNLLGKGEDLGITVVLLEKGTKGLQIGDHHLPIGDSFYNGPIIGKDVVAPITDTLGGTEYIGKGWQMLMEALAGGRAISLPAGAIGAAKSVATVTGPYSIVRQQFGMSIGNMEGIEAQIAKINGLTYMLDGARIYTCAAIDRGEAPPVLSAILKQQSTQLARELGTAGMDVFSGAGVMQGPNNILGPGYCSAPVGITVEGANIMTRSLIIYGQGAILCHPYANKVLSSLEQKDVSAFRANLLGWMGHFAKNFARSIVRGLTRGWSVGSPVSGPQAKYYRRLGWASSRFALLTDLALFTVGAKLKARGNLSGRFADVLSWQYLAISALRRYEAEGAKAEDLPLLQWSCDYALARIQEGFEGIYANFNAPVLGLWLKTIGLFGLKINPIGSEPSDQLGHQAAEISYSLNDSYRRLTEGTYIPDASEPGAGRLLEAFRLLNEAAPAAAKLRKAVRSRELPRLAGAELIEAAVAKNIISKDEANQLGAAEQARLEAIEVDVFTPEEYFREMPRSQADMELPQAVNA